MNLKEIRFEARESLKGNWGTAIGAWIVSLVIPLGIVWFVTPIFGSVLGSGVEMLLDIASNLLIGGVLTAGLSWVFLGLVDRKQESVGNLFAGFKNYGRVVATHLLITLFILLWMIPLVLVASLAVGALIVWALIIDSMLLTIIFMILWFLGYMFGILLIATRYAMAMYIIKDYPLARPMAAIEESKKLMKGKYLKYILLQLQFMLWHLPGIIAMVAALIIFIYEIFWLIYWNPSMAYQIAAGNFSPDFVQSILLAVLLLIIGALYHFGISFFVAPYRHAANAVFYRKLAPKTSEDFVSTVENGLSEPNAVVFANNTPPKAPAEDLLVTEDTPTSEVPVETVESDVTKTEELI